MQQGFQWAKELSKNTSLPIGRVNNGNLRGVSIASRNTYGMRCWSILGPDTSIEAGSLSNGPNGSERVDGDCTGVNLSRAIALARSDVSHGRLILA